jgi:hypothetical protein
VVIAGVNPEYFILPPAPKRIASSLVGAKFVTPYFQNYDGNFCFPDADKKFGDHKLAEGQVLLPGTGTVSSCWHTNDDKNNVEKADVSPVESANQQLCYHVSMSVKSKGCASCYSNANITCDISATVLTPP